MKTVRYIAIGLILAASAVPASASFAQSPAPAARSFDHCIGFIDSLPATIVTPGTWCLRHDLSTTITGGTAIAVNSDNVTIDCNNFAIEGSAAGTGIHSEDRRHITVRQCKVRGFGFGVNLSANFLITGGGHLVEDNQLDLNVSTGLQVIGGEKSVVRSNVLRDNGSIPMIMIGFIDIIENTVIGAGAGGRAVGFGILAELNTAGRVSGNRIRDVARIGIRLVETGESVVVTGNHLNANPGRFPGGFSTIGIQCGEAPGPVFDNIIVGFDSPVMGCNAFDNTIAPRRGQDTP